MITPIVAIITIPSRTTETGIKTKQTTGTKSIRTASSEKPTRPNW